MKAALALALACLMLANGVLAAGGRINVSAAGCWRGQAFGRACPPTFPPVRRRRPSLYLLAWPLQKYQPRQGRRLSALSRRGLIEVSTKKLSGCQRLAAGGCALHHGSPLSSPMPPAPHHPQAYQAKQDQGHRRLLALLPSLGGSGSSGSGNTTCELHE